MIKLRIAAFAFATSLAALAPLGGCGPLASKQRVHGDWEAVEALEKLFVEKLSSGDVDGLVEGYYAEDAVLMPPNQASVKGRSAIAAMLRAWPPVKDVELKSSEIGGSGDFAYSTGTYSMTLLIPGAAPVRDTGKFIDISRRQPDGSWKVTHDIFNSDLPATPQ